MYSDCSLCPRTCHADRNKIMGACHSGAQLKIARAALHMWEEPCISGVKGSGAVFFSGCSLGCVFCQNHEISRGQAGTEITTQRLGEIFFELWKQGANNINLVTPDHFIVQICEAIRDVKVQGFSLPFIYNCSGYESVASLRMLDGLVDVYLPDFKYWESKTAAKYSCAGDYPVYAKSAIAEMVRQCGPCRFDESGMIQSGVIVRHLLLPGKVKEAKKIVQYLYETYGDDIYMSLMNQYTPRTYNSSAGGNVLAGGNGESLDEMARYEQFPELHRKVTKREYERLLDFAVELGVTNAFIQEGETATESFIPAFDLEGVKKDE